MVRQSLSELRYKLQLPLIFYSVIETKNKTNKKTIAKCKLWGQKKSKLQNVKFRIVQKKSEM